MIDNPKGWMQVLFGVAGVVYAVLSVRVGELHDSKRASGRYLRYRIQRENSLLGFWLPVAVYGGLGAGAIVFGLRALMRR